MSEQGYDPTTDPHWMGEEPVVSTEDRAGELAAELTELAQQRATLDSPGWQIIADTLFHEMQSAAMDLVTFRPDRTPAHFAFVQGQIAKVQSMLTLPERIRQEYEAKSVELTELQEPALA